MAVYMKSEVLRAFSFEASRSDETGYIYSHLSVSRLRWVSETVLVVLGLFLVSPRGDNRDLKHEVTSADAPTKWVPGGLEAGPSSPSHWSTWLMGGCLYLTGSAVTSTLGG
jgi:hypothetical protein